MSYEEAEEIRRTIIEKVEEYKQYAEQLRDMPGRTAGAKECLDWEVLGYEQAIQAIKETRLGTA